MDENDDEMQGAMEWLAGEKLGEQICNAYFLSDGTGVDGPLAVKVITIIHAAVQGMKPYIYFGDCVRRRGNQPFCAIFV